MDFSLVLVLILLGIGALASASEIMLISLTPAQIRTLVEARVSGAEYLNRLKQKHHKTLITILLVNNFMNTALSAVLTVFMTNSFGENGIGIALVVATVLILLFGEILPKALASTYAKFLGPKFAPGLYWICAILTPLTSLVDVLVVAMRKLVGADDPSKVTDEELIAMASIGAEEGSIDANELDLIENALEFNDIRVGDIITPRVHMEALPEDYHLDNAAEFVVNRTHTRIPIYRDNIDNIVGILSIKELLRAMHEEEHPEKVSVRQINLLKPLKAPVNMQVRDLFREFKKERQHMAIVVDEYGGTAGLVTMEDLLEELVGEIEDEVDANEEHVKTVGKDHYELSGRTELDEIAELTGLEFDHPEYKTVSFLITHTLGQVAKEGVSIVLGKWRFTVKQMLRHTILKVALKKIKR